MANLKVRPWNHYCCRVPPADGPQVRALAWCDESGSSRVRDPGVYLVSGAVISADAAVNVRDEVERMRSSPNQKFHWVHQSLDNRDRTIALLAHLPFSGLVQVRISTAVERDARRRRKCLELFLPGLADYGCREAIFESRGVRPDALDIEFVRASRQKSLLARDFRVGSAKGFGEPNLWIADAICGAVVAARLGEPKWLDELKAKVRVIVAGSG